MKLKAKLKKLDCKLSKSGNVVYIKGYGGVLKATLGANDKAVLRKVEKILKLETT